MYWCQAKTQFSNIIAIDFYLNHLCCIAGSRFSFWSGISPLCFECKTWFEMQPVQSLFTSHEALLFKWALCAMVNRLQSMSSNEEFRRHEKSLYLYYLVLALPVCLAVLLVAQLYSKVFRLRGEAGVLLHKRYMRTIALGIAAAQASSLLCVDWATTFYILLLVVPLLGGKWDNQHNMVQYLLQCCMVFIFAMLIFSPCIMFVSSNAFAPLFQSFQSSLTVLPHSLRLIITSWDITCLSAVLTLAAPAYLCTFV